MFSTKQIIRHCNHRLGLPRYLSVVAFNNESITVKLNNGNSSNFNNVFLRDSCTSIESVDPYSKQKLFTTPSIFQSVSIEGEPAIETDPKSNEKVLAVTWKNQDGTFHKSTYTNSFLENHSCNSVVHQNTVFDRIHWDGKLIAEKYPELQVGNLSYFDDQLFAKVVDNVNKYGLYFVNGISDPAKNPNTQAITASNEVDWPVWKLASKFGYIKKTFYGNLFDVKNEKEAKNIANTNTFLPLHMDLLYYESPPGLQLLHFIWNSTKGGENVFSDSFAAAAYVKSVDTVAYEALKQVPVTYHYNNNNEYYYYSRPVIVEDPYDKCPITGDNVLKEVNYSPPFQGPLQFSTLSLENKSLMNNFYRGFSLFEDFVTDPKNQLRIKMKEGSCVIFDNRRVLHSRLEFSDENGGDRWLMGCYVDGDSFRSKLRMAKKLNLDP